MSTAKKRRKIRFCYEDYCRTVTEKERQEHREKFSVLIEIIYSAVDDDEVIARAKAHDAEHGTDLFGEAVNFKAYCVACHRVDCIC